MSVWSLSKDCKEEHIGSFPLAGFVRSTEKVCGSDVSSPQFMKVSKEMKNDALTGQQNFCLLLLMAETSLRPHQPTTPGEVTARNRQRDLRDTAVSWLDIRLEGHNP